MKKLMNAPDAYVDDMLDGLCTAYPSLVRDGRVIRSVVTPRKGKVGIVSGGGSGHLPLFTGYVGPGFIDACAIGEVFAGPTVDACIGAIRAADAGRMFAEKSVGLDDPGMLAFARMLEALLLAPETETRLPTAVTRASA